MPTQRHLTTTLGGILLILLGLARGAGGLVLGIQGPGVVDSSRSGTGTAQALGLGLLAIGLLAIFAAARVLRDRPNALTFALAILLIFVLDGALNGYLLFGHPGNRGTIVNVLAALTIGVLLWTGERAATRTNSK